MAGNSGSQGSDGDDVSADPEFQAEGHAADAGAASGVDGSAPGSPTQPVFGQTAFGSFLSQGNPTTSTSGWTSAGNFPNFAPGPFSTGSAGGTGSNFTFTGAGVGFSSAQASGSTYPGLPQACYYNPLPSYGAGLGNPLPTTGAGVANPLPTLGAGLVNPVSGHGTGLEQGTGPVQGSLLSQQPGLGTMPTNPIQALPIAYQPSYTIEFKERDRFNGTKYPV